MCAIKNAFTSLMPVIITGSFCTLITNVVCATEGNGISLGKLPGMQWLSMFTDWFNAANYATLNFFTVAAVVLIGLELGRLNKLDGFMPGIISLCSFISCLPTVVQITHDDVVIDVANVLGKDYTAARGLFLGDCNSLDICGNIYKACKQWVYEDYYARFCTQQCSRFL